MRDRGAPGYYVAVRTSGKGAKAEYINLETRVEAFRYADSESRADVLTLTVNNFDLANFDDPVWKQGNILQFAYGFESGLSPVREAVIRSVKGGTTLQIEAHGKAVIMDRVKIRESHDNMTRSDVVRRIARRNGYGSDTTFIQDTAEVFPIITQPNLTDAQMIRKLAHKEGFEFYVDFDGLHWHERKVDKSPIRELIYYTDPGQGDIQSFDITSDVTRKPARVRVCSRDPLTKKRICARADNSTETEGAVMQEGKPHEEFRTYVDGETGSTTSETVPLDQPTANEEDIASNGQTEVEVKTEAKKRFRKARQRAVKMTMTIIGDHRLVAKAVVQVSGLGARLSGKYYIVEVVSELTAGGGFSQQLSLITDGYQKKSGKPDAKRSSDQNLAKSVTDIVVAIVNNMQDLNIRVAAERFGKGALDILKKNPGPTEYAKLARATVRFARAVQGRSSKLSPADQKRVGPILKSVANLGSAFNSLADSAGGKNLGKLNKKGVKDPGELTPQTHIDGETGKETTKFVDKGGRED